METITLSKKEYERLKKLKEIWENCNGFKAALEDVKHGRLIAGI